MLQKLLFPFFPVLIWAFIFAPSPTNALLSLQADMVFPASSSQMSKLDGKWSRSGGHADFPDKLLVRAENPNHLNLTFTHKGKRVDALAKLVLWQGYHFALVQKQNGTEQALYLFQPDETWSNFKLYAFDLDILRDILSSYLVIASPSSEFKNHFKIQGQPENVKKLLSSPEMIRRLLWSKRHASYGKG